MRAARFSGLQVTTSFAEARPTSARSAVASAEDSSPNVLTSPACSQRPQSVKSEADFSAFPEALRPDCCCMHPAPAGLQVKQYTLLTWLEPSQSQHAQATVT